jgi:DinB superfamily
MQGGLVRQCERPPRLEYATVVSTELAALLARDLTRLVQQLRAFPDQESLWNTAPGIANSAGNLALHLEGNLREYIGRQLGNMPYERHRPLEFSEKGLPVEDMIARIEQVQRVIPEVIRSLSSATLDAPYPEQVLGVPLTTRQFLIHLLGHFNYHLGQIDYLRRMTTGAGAITLAGL